ncbi:MAG TPA: hypothetical protein VHK05_01450 [Candidatus Limnocylindrales bacterium]|jgi:hypothetical protein|nr:hypothetical protein [Candidatus Limnocylindrales bacterium]
MNDDRWLDRAARSFIEVGPTAAPPYVVDEVLVLIERLPQERDWFPWRFPRMTLPARVAALVVVGVLIIVGAAAIGVGRPDTVTPAPSVAPPSVPASPPAAVVATPLASAAARPPAPTDRAAAERITRTFLDHLNASELDQAAALVWPGAMINGVPVTTADEVIAQLEPLCGFGFGPILLGGGNTVSWEGGLMDRPGHPCPQAGAGVRTRTIVENGLVVEFEPDAMRGQIP